MPSSVREHCEKRGLTIEQIAQQAGLDAQRVSAIYLGRWTPSPAERQSIAAALHVEVEDITWGHATPIQHLYGHGPG
ncbi:MAG: helix-turn-helix transcriptional regulator [Planctomycetia bacterium]|nr:helix-turn-helix transcriptional regulator [Planctomycetia bacterium]